MLENCAKKGGGGTFDQIQAVEFFPPRSAPYVECQIKCPTTQSRELSPGICWAASLFGDFILWIFYRKKNDTIYSKFPHCALRRLVPEVWYFCWGFSGCVTWSNCWEMERISPKFPPTILKRIWNLPPKCWKIATLKSTGKKKRGHVHFMVSVSCVYGGGGGNQERADWDCVLCSSSHAETLCLPRMFVGWLIGWLCVGWIICLCVSLPHSRTWLEIPLALHDPPVLFLPFFSATPLGSPIATATHTILSNWPPVPHRLFVRRKSTTPSNCPAPLVTSRPAQPIPVIRYSASLL